MRSLFLAIFIIVVLSTRKKLIFLFLSPENFYHCKSYFMAAIAFLLMQHMFMKLYLALLIYSSSFTFGSWSFKIMMIFQDHHDLSWSIMIMSVPCLLSVFLFLTSLTFNGIYRFSTNDFECIGAKCICITKKSQLVRWINNAHAKNSGNQFFCIWASMVLA